MFNGILILLFDNKLECEDLNYQFRQILGQLRRDCDTCDDSSELAELRDNIEDFVLGSLGDACGWNSLRIEGCNGVGVANPSQGWNQVAIERTTEIVNLVNDLPTRLKMKVQSNSTILQNIDKGISKVKPLITSRYIIMAPPPLSI